MDKSGRNVAFHSSWMHFKTLKTSMETSVCIPAVWGIVLVFVQQITNQTTILIWRFSTVGGKSLQLWCYFTAPGCVWPLTLRMTFGTFIVRWTACCLRAQTCASVFKTNSMVNDRHLEEERTNMPENELKVKLCIFYSTSGARPSRFDFFFTFVGYIIQVNTVTQSDFIHCSLISFQTASYWVWDEVWMWFSRCPTGSVSKGDQICFRRCDL